MYLDFIILFSDYFRTLNRRILLFEWVLPAFLSLCFFCSLRLNNSEKNLMAYRENIISLFGVLIGFSITIITLLLTANNDNIKILQNNLTKNKLGRRQLSLYEMMIMNFSYSIVMEVFVIVANLFFPALNAHLQFCFTTKLILFSINSLFVLHILLLNVRNISDLYFSLVSNQDPSIKPN